MLQLSFSKYIGTPATPATPANIVQGLPDWASQITNTDTVAAVAQILQSPQGQQVSEHGYPVSQLLTMNLLCINSWPDRRISTFNFPV